MTSHEAWLSQAFISHGCYSPRLTLWVIIHDWRHTLDWDRLKCYSELIRCLSWVSKPILTFFFFDNTLTIEWSCNTDFHSLVLRPFQAEGSLFVNLHLCHVRYHSRLQDSEDHWKKASHFHCVHCYRVHVSQLFSFMIFFDWCRNFWGV